MGKVVKTIAIIAVVVAIAVLAPYIGVPLAAALGATGVAATAITMAVTLALTAAASFAMKAAGLTPRPGIPGSRGGSPSVFRQSITESFIVYGKRRVGGLIVFFHSKKSGSDHLRYFVIAVAGHRCQGIDSWMLNDDVVSVDGSGMVTSGPYASHAWLWFQRGLASETANATFVAECDGKWTSAHKGNGVAAIYAKFRMKNDLIEAGFPNITAVIEGKDDILDPRDATEKYTANAALVTYDWMQLPREEGGFGAYADEIPDDDYISAQANVCDEAVSIPGGGTEPRYELNGVIITGATPSDIRETLVINMAGAHSYAGGKFLIRPGYYVPASATFEEDNFTGAITVNAFMAGDQTANRVEGTYIEPARGYLGQPFATQATPGATDIRQMDLDLGFVTSKYQAERVASIMLKRAEAEKSVQCTTDMTGLKVQALDTIQLNTARYGLSNYAFMITGWAMTADWNVALTMREENEDIYGAPSMSAPGTPPDISTPSGGPTDPEISQGILNSYITTSGVVTAADVGTTATISIAAHTRQYPDKAVSVNAGSVTGLSFATEYYVYYDDENRAGGAVTYGATTAAASGGPSATNPFRHSVGRITTPADGAGGTTGAGGTAPWIPGVSSASGITFAPAGGVAATNVQAAIQELDTEKASLSAAVNFNCMRATGNSIPTSGAGVTIYYQASEGLVEAYDWGSASYKPFNFNGSAHRFKINGTNKIQMDTNTAIFSVAIAVDVPSVIGYMAGAGGSVTQATNKSTGVTLNTPTGQITMNGAALAANTSVAFTLTNSKIAANDTIDVNIKSGATSGAYVVIVQAVAGGSCSIMVRNVSGGSLSEALVLNFTVFRGSAI